MPDAERRIVLLPAGVSDKESAALLAAVRAAVEAQQRLAAKSQYVLHFTGDVERTDEGIVIGHEPAAALPIEGLYNREAPGADAELLLRTAAGLLEALGAAHGGAAGKPIIHGGLCPGVLLTDESGIVKVTDFGIAPAICQVLSEDAYSNLALGLARAGVAGVSGYWEILSVNEYTRDDRLCAFIDPEKYADNTLRTFESPSDVIAAGLILHLLAEHRNPYLTDPEAHRDAAMSAGMAFEVFRLTRRADLSKSPDAGVKLWCELVARMLVRVPRDRPSASELAKQFEPYIPKVDFDRIKALRWLKALEAVHGHENLEATERLLHERPELASWPAEVLAKTKPIQTWANEQRAERKREAAIAADRKTAEEWFARFQGAVQAKEWEAAQALWNKRPDLAHWPEDTLRESELLLAPLRAGMADLERGRKEQADHAAAQKWLGAVEKEVGAGNWQKARDLLSDARPALTFWPAGLLEAIASHEQVVQERLAEIERDRLAVEADHRAAREWLTSARVAADAGDDERALDLLGSPPTLTHWPARLREEADALAHRCRENLIGEAVKGLRAREAAVTRLGDEFVRAALLAELRRFVAPEMVASTVGQIEFAPEADAADGRAQLTVSLSTAADAQPGAGLRSGFQFRDQRAPIGICDADGALRQWLLRGMTERLLELQKAKAADIAAALHGELFPKAEVALEITQLRERVKAVVHLLGKAQARGDVETEFQWEPKSLAWTYVDAKGFAQRALHLATVLARNVAATKLIEQSEGLKAYKSAIAVEVASAQTPEPGVIPRSLLLEGKLSLRVGANGEPHPLQTISITSAKAGQITLSGDLKPAEATLREIVVRAQNASRDALASDIDKRVKTARAKVKTSAAPKKIAEPVDEVSFELRPKAGAAATLTAAWNTSTFQFDTMPTWEGTLSALLAPPSTNGEPREDKKKSPERTGQTDGNGNRNRRGMVLGGAVIGLAVIAVGAYFLKGVIWPEDVVETDAKAGELTATVVGNELRVQFAYDIILADGYSPPAFRVAFYSDRNRDGTAQADEFEGETPGAVAAEAHVADFVIRLPAQRAQEETRMLIAVLDTAAWGNAESDRGNNAQSTSVVIPATGAPQVARVRVDGLTVAPLAAAATKLDAKFTYFVMGENAVQPFEVRLFWDAQADGAFGADDVEAGRAQIADAAELSPGAHEQVIEIQLEPIRAQAETKTLSARIPPEVGGGDEDAGKDFASATANIPATPAVRAADVHVTGLKVEPVDANSTTIVATAKYEVVAGDGAGPFVLRFFWDLKQDGRYVEGEDELIEDVTVDSAVSGEGRTSKPLPQERAWATAERLVVLADTSNWQPKEGDASNNSKSEDIGPRQPPPPRTPADVTITGLTPGPVDEQSSSIQATATYTVSEGEAGPFSIKFYWDLNRNGQQDEPAEATLSAIVGERPAPGETGTAQLPPWNFPSTDFALDKSELLVAFVDATGWDPPEAGPGANTNSTEVGPRRKPDIVREFLEAESNILFNVAKTPKPALDALLGAFVPSDGEVEQTKTDRAFLLAATDAEVRLDQPVAAGADAVSISVTVKAKDVGAAKSMAFTVQRVDGQWSGAPENAGKLVQLAADVRAVLTDALTKAVTDVAAHAAVGELQRAYERAAIVANIPELMAGTEADKQFVAVLNALPPSFDDAKPLLASYERSADTDPLSGYPRHITDASKRVLLLVAVAPNDPLWAELASAANAPADAPLKQLVGMAPTARPWFLFYVDAEESENFVNTFGDAENAAKALGRVLPTRDEWTLAALRTAPNEGAKGVIGDAFEWCGPPSGKGAWVCGGCSLVDAFAHVAPLPKPDSGAAQLWVALNDNPLITQIREHGDDLCRIRTILRVFPTQPPP